MQGSAASDSAVAVVKRLEEARRGMRALLLVSGFIWFVLLEMALATAMIAADWMWVLPAPLRGVGLAAMGVVAVLWLRRMFVNSARLTRGHTAGEVEGGFPQLGQRVRTTLEYAEPTPATAPASPGLVDALLNDTHKRIASVDLDLLVRPGSTIGGCVLLVAFTVVALILLATSSELRIAVVRMLLKDVHYTQLQVEPGNQVVKVSSDVTVRTRLSGRPVKYAALRYREVGDDKARWTELPLGDTGQSDAGQDDERPVYKSGSLESTIANCRRDLEYQVVADQVRSEVFRLTVVNPLKLKSVVTSIAPPKYTRHKPSRVPRGNVQVIAGSRVGLHFKLDRAPKTASLTLKAKSGDRGPGSGDRERGRKSDGESELRVSIDGPHLTAVLPRVESALVYTLHAEAADGMKLPPTRFRIQVRADEKPSIRFLAPPEQLEVTPTTDIGMGVEAQDDFGVANVGIVYRVADGSEETLYMRDLPRRPTVAEALATLFLEQYEVSYTDSLSYYAFAQDNHPDTPHRVTTELRFVDIRPYKMAYQLKKEGGT